MRYLMILYSREHDIVDLPQGAAEVSLADDINFHKSMAKHGRLLTAERLYPSATATTLRNRASGIVTNDGSFAESGNQISRFYIIESPDLDEALQIATWILAVHSGAIEVRPIVEVSGKVNLNGSDE